MEWATERKKAIFGVKMAIGEREKGCGKGWWGYGIEYLYTMH